MECLFHGLMFSLGRNHWGVGQAILNCSSDTTAPPYTMLCIWDFNDGTLNSSSFFLIGVDVGECALRKDKRKNLLVSEDGNVAVADALWRLQLIMASDVEWLFIMSTAWRSRRLAAWLSASPNGLHVHSREQWLHSITIQLIWHIKLEYLTTCATTFMNSLNPIITWHSEQTTVKSRAWHEMYCLVWHAISTPEEHKLLLHLYPPRIQLQPWHVHDGHSNNMYSATFIANLTPIGLENVGFQIYNYWKGKVTALIDSQVYLQGPHNPTIEAFLSAFFERFIIDMVYLSPLNLWRYIQHVNLDTVFGLSGAALQLAFLTFWEAIMKIRACMPHWKEHYDKTLHTIWEMRNDPIQRV